MKANKKTNQNPDYIFSFKYMCVDCHLDFEIFDEDDRREILDILRMITEDITIDKTFVEYKGTKYKKTFISEDGWNQLCDLVTKTKLGKKTTIRQSTALRESYVAMALCYIYQFFEDIGYDTSYMSFEYRYNSNFDTEIIEDTAREWERYPGDWRTWDWK